MCNSIRVTATLRPVRIMLLRAWKVLPRPGLRKSMRRSIVPIRPNRWTISSFDAPIIRFRIPTDASIPPVASKTADITPPCNISCDIIPHQIVSHLEAKNRLIQIQGLNLNPQQPIEGNPILVDFDGHFNQQNQYFDLNYLSYSYIQLFNVIVYLNMTRAPGLCGQQSFFIQPFHPLIIYGNIGGGVVIAVIIAAPDPLNDIKSMVVFWNEKGL